MEDSAMMPASSTWLNIRNRREKQHKQPYDHDLWGQSQFSSAWTQNPEALEIIILKIPKVETPNINLSLLSKSLVWFILVLPLRSNPVIFGELIELTRWFGVCVSTNKI
jgi:hypothetical protein